MIPDYPPFPTAIDNTLREAFVTCPHKFFLEYLQHWKPSEESIHLVAGGAYAAGLEHARKAYWDEAVDKEEALHRGLIALIKKYGDYEADDNDTKSCINMLAALIEYFDHYGWTSDYIKPYRDSSGKHAIEFSFAIPIDVLHPITNEPILYTGRFDLLGLYNSQLYVCDDKTSKSLGSYWHNNWPLRSQFTGYCWAAQQYDYPVAGAIIRGIGLLKTKFTHEESIQYRPLHMIERWYKQLCLDIEAMKRCWHKGYWDYNLGPSCSNYGGCPFVPVCSSLDESRILEASFVKRVWDPLEKETLDVPEAKSNDSENNPGGVVNPVNIA